MCLSFIDSHACVEEICKLIRGQLRAQVSVVSVAKPRSADHDWSEIIDHRPDLLNEFIEYNNIVGATLPNARTAIRRHHTLPLLIRRKALGMTQVTMA